MQVAELQAQVAELTAARDAAVAGLRRTEGELAEKQSALDAAMETVTALTAGIEKHGRGLLSLVAGTEGE